MISVFVIILAPWRLLAVDIVPAKEHALLSVDLVFPRWVMITWSVEIDGISRALIEYRMDPRQSVVAHGRELHMAIIGNVRWIIND